MIVITSRVSGTKYCFAVRLQSSNETLRKVSYSPSAEVMSFWMTSACPSCDAFSLIDRRLTM